MPRFHLIIIALCLFGTSQGQADTIYSLIDLPSLNRWDNMSLKQLNLVFEQGSIYAVQENYRTISAINKRNPNWEHELLSCDSCSADFMDFLKSHKGTLKLRNRSGESRVVFRKFGLVKKYKSEHQLVVPDQVRITIRDYKFNREGVRIERKKIDKYLSMW